MIRKIRKSWVTKVFVVYFSISLLSNFIFQMDVFALGGGPSQPEVNGFTPAGVDNLVDPYTGDFKYNIPLIDVGGYPLNMGYNSGISMDQEASMVGLGWNLNVGAITRNLRGLPDEFSGDLVTKEFSMRPNTTYGVTASFAWEIFGNGPAGEAVGSAGGAIVGALAGGTSTETEVSANVGLDVKYNTYDGVGFALSYGLSADRTKDPKGENESSLGLGLNVSQGTEGLKLKPDVTFSSKIEEREKSDFDLKSKKNSISGSFNSRQGLTNLAISQSIKGSETYKSKGVSKTRDFRGGNSGSISFVNSSYTPQIDFPRRGVSGELAIRFGADIFGIDGDVSLGGYINDSRLATNSLSVPAYGYMNGHKKPNNAKVAALLDFNREKERGFTLNTTNLPVTNQTYDLYNIAAQGVGGQFRAHRSDVGHIHDNYVKSNTGGGNLGIEIAGGNLFGIGADFTGSWSNSHSGNWVKQNDAKSKLEYRGTNTPQYEPYYFKQVGDLSVDNESWLNNSTLQEANPAQLGINTVTPVTHRLDNRYYNQLGSSNVLASSQTIRNNRAKRNVGISTLSVTEAKELALDKSYSAYTNSVLPGHHFGEIDVVQGDGSIYKFGLPAVNSQQREVTFNISGASPDLNSGLVTYNPSVDNSTNNSRGTDHYFSATNTPAFAHSHMLTSILSTDYVDYDAEEGPSIGDRGTYVKFTYGEEVVDGSGNRTREPDVQDYKWRVPYQANKANFNRGLQTLNGDNKANYTFGRKDLWYVHTIETKTQVAKFYYSDRKDGRGVIGEDGGMGSESMRKLDRIALYSLADYRAGNLKSPIKEVHFEYDYSLCKGIPNNNSTLPLTPTEISNEGGKLTLKRVYFTYEGVPKGRLSPYEFSYDGNLNPSYNLKGYDVWGGVKENPNAFLSDGISSAYTEYTSDFPYVQQVDKAAQDQLASAWCISSIETPMGSKIKIDYESDDYAYVQDKEAMQMAKIVGAGKTTAIGQMSDKLYDNIIVDPFQEGNDILFFKKPKNKNGSGPITDLSKMFRFAAGRDHYLYFNFLLDLDNNGNKDYVPGYAKFRLKDENSNLNYGTASDNSDYAWMRLEKVRLGDRKQDGGNVNPISKTGWGFERLFNPKLAYGLSDPSGVGGASDEDKVQVLKGLASMITSITSVISDGNRGFRAKNYCQTFVPNKSWIRLHNPIGCKLGGNCRVSKVRIFDDWAYNTNGSEESFDYGQEFSYTLESGVSSGVATYEPLISRENPLVQPVFFDDKKLFAPDDKHYMETPFGESFFPNPSVGYSRVEVKSLQRNDVDDLDNDSDTDELIVKRHATGRVVNEFYTAKDYPTIANQTNIQIGRSPKVVNLISQLLKVRVVDLMNVSQGYMVEKFDDMPGREKKKSIYAEGQNQPLSSVRYEYQTKEESIVYLVGGNTSVIDVKKLDNDVVVINNDGSVETSTLGVDVDIVNDFRDQETKSYSVGLDGEANGFLIGIIPVLPVPTFWPSFTSEHTGFRSSVTTKVINHYGILSKTIASDLGASVETKNLARDAETGEVLLTQTTNEYDDELYSFAYPAHWAYDDGMGQLAQNINYSTKVTTNGTGEITSSTNLLVPGDEVYWANIPVGSTNYNEAWVSKNASGDLHLIDRAGSPYTNLSNVFMKVIRSGHRNQHTVSLGNIVFRDNPIVSDGAGGQELVLPQDMLSKQVLTAEASEFSEDWKTFCSDICDEPEETGCIDTPEELLAGMDDIAYGLIQAGIPVGPSGVPSYTLPDGYECAQVGLSAYIARELPPLVSFNYNTTANGFVYFGIAANGNSYPLLSITFPPDCYPPCPCSDPAAAQAAYLEDLAMTFESAGVFGTTLGCASVDQDLLIQLIGNECNVSIGNAPCPPKKGYDFPIASYGVQVNGSSIEYYAIDAITGFQVILITVNFLEGCGPCSGEDPVLNPNPGEDPNDALCAAELNGVVNPYIEGVRGNWRPKRNAVLLTDREQSAVAFNTPSQPNDVYTRTDGRYTSFTPFWEYNSGSNRYESHMENSSYSNKLWTWASEITEHHPFGMEIENRDRLMRYSAELLGFNNTLPVAVGNNTTYNQIAYDGFEDYGYLADCTPHHICSNVKDLNLIKTGAHTGRYSLEVPFGANYHIKAKLRNSIPLNLPHGVPYVMKKQDCLYGFSPETYNVVDVNLNPTGSFSGFLSPDIIAPKENKYVLSYWVKQLNPTNTVYEFDKHQPVVQINSTPITLDATVKSGIIDGWQRFEYLFTVPASATGELEIFVNNGFTDGTSTIQLDDVRIHPLNSSVKSFVYDPESLRLWAQLDANNYATYYEYDEQGDLIRIKKETYNGIRTVSETRENTIKNGVIPDTF